VALYACVAILSTLVYLPKSWLLLGGFSLVFTIVVLNSQFYVFLAEKRGRVFALAAIPFHLLYHFYNGISFALGLARHVWKHSFQGTRPSPLGRKG
jgi:hypothetical protein